MPADATNTTYPTTLDLRPAIGANDSEQATGLEHDVQHDHSNALLNAIQQLIGTTGSTDPATILGAIAALVSDKLDASEVGVSVATLVGGQVPSAQLPSYVDDVIEVADYASLPATGETGKIYIVEASGPDPANSQYRWNGSSYTLLVASPGTTDAVPEGTTNLYFTNQRAYLAVKAAINAGTHSGVSFAFNDATPSISVTASGGGGGSGDVRDFWLMG